MDFSRFDFLDFGCSKGGTIKQIEKLEPDLLGLGIDIAHHKIEEARRAGCSAIFYDILKLPEKNSLVL